MRNISRGLAFKYHYNGEASIAEEFQSAKEGVDHVDVPNSVYNRLDFVIPIRNVFTQAFGPHRCF